MSRHHALVLSALAAAAALAVTLSGLDCILGLKPFVHQVKFGMLAAGLAAMALLADRSWPAAAPLRTGVGVHLAGMSGCYAGLLLIANFPAPLASGWALAPVAGLAALTLIALRLRAAPPFRPALAR